MKESFNNQPQVDEQEKKPKLVFNNYKPLDPNLLKLKNDNLSITDVKPFIQHQIEISKNPSVLTEISADSLQQKKIDEDLKRDLKDKLTLLANKTRKYIVELANAKIHEEELK